MSVKLSKFRVDDTMIEIDVPNGSVTEEKLSPEVAEKLNSGGESGGGVEFKTLDVTVTLGGSNHLFSGSITSEIPENIEINDIIKIEDVEVSGEGQYAFTTYSPLPTLSGRTDLGNNNFQLTGYMTYTKIDAVTDMGMPLGLYFVALDTNNDSTTLTVTLKITYV